MDAIRFDTVDDPEAGVVVCFTGRGDEGEAWSPFDFLANEQDRELNVLHVRDVYRRWFQCGVPGLGNDVNEVAESLKRMLAPYKGRRLITIGHGVGGYGAILFGLLIGAQRIIAMGPQTFIDPNLRAATNDQRWATHVDRIEPARMVHGDLLPLLKQNKGTLVSIFYVRRNGLDSLHASRAAEAPYVTLFGMDSQRTNIIAGMLEQGVLRTVVEAEMAGHPLPPPFSEDSGPTWRMDPVPGSRKCVVVFSSRGRGFGAFELSNTFKDTTCSMLYVRDPLNGWYNLPIRGIGENIDEITRWIRAKLDEYGIEEVRTIGGSMGGFGAILFGCQLNATSALTFAPQTFIDPQLRALHRDTRWQENMMRIGEPSCGDLLPLIEANSRQPNPMRIIAHYAGQVDIDAVHVERIAHLPNVVAKPHVSARHNIARELQKRQAFVPAIVEGLELERAG